MNDEQFMKRALELAEQGRGLTSPGAMVGALVVADDEIVGEGTYTFDGVKHAETLALEQAGDRAEGATVFVSLEPCTHEGRTAPCVDALIAAAVARVVTAIRDPDPRVDGAGLAALGRAGIRVESGLLADEARTINEAFIHERRNGRPFGILKVAMSLDGKIATASGESRWITSDESRQRVQFLRHSVDALLTGSGTILKDDPRLTDRTGLPRRRPLLRAVIDRRGRLHSRLKIFEAPGVRIYTEAPHLETSGLHEVCIGISHLRDVMADLTRREIQSFMLECGPDLAFDALRAGIIDKIVVFIAPRILGGREVPAFGSGGVHSLAEAVGIDNWKVERVGPDLMVTGYVHRDR